MVHIWWVMGHISDGSVGHGSIPMTQCLLCFSAAFNTVNHDTLLERLQTEFGVTSLAPAYLEGQTQVCQDWSTSVANCGARGRRSSGVCSWASVVCCLLQFSRRYRHKPWSSLPSTRRWHSFILPWMPTIQLQECLFLQRAPGVPAERPAAQPGQVVGSDRRSAVCHRLIHYHLYLSPV